MTALLAKAGHAGITGHSAEVLAVAVGIALGVGVAALVVWMERRR